MHATGQAGDRQMDALERRVRWEWGDVIRDITGPGSDEFEHCVRGLEYSRDLELQVEVINSIINDRGWIAVVDFCDGDSGHPAYARLHTGESEQPRRCRVNFAKQG